MDESCVDVVVDSRVKVVVGEEVEEVDSRTDVVVDVEEVVVEVVVLDELVEVLVV